jgi:hypothetical protein
MRTEPTSLPRAAAAHAFAAWRERHGGEVAALHLYEGTLLAVWCAAWRQAQAAMLAEAARRDLGLGLPQRVSR